MSDILLIGERINSSNKRVRRILETRDQEALIQLAAAQVQGGASYIDINASMLMGDEKPALEWAARCITEQLDAGVSLDSPDMDVLLEMPATVQGPVLLNSITCDENGLNLTFGAAAEHGASVIVMLKSRDGIPETAEGRIELAGRIDAAAEAAGVPPSRIFIDPVFSPLATSAEGMRVVLGTIAALRRKYPEHHRIGGLSNISYGLPRRKLINRTFLAMALSHGLDAVICDTTDPALMDTLTASEPLIGNDPGCRRFLQSYRLKKHQ